MQEEPVIVDFLNFESETMVHIGRVQHMKVDPKAVEQMLRFPVDRYTATAHWQHMLSLVWRSTGVDEFRVTTILEALKLRAHVLGMSGNSHWSAKDINSKKCLRLTNLAEESMTVERANI